MEGKRLIDANALDFGFALKHSLVELYVEFIKSRVAAAPTVDAVEVVRCEKCKHYDSLCGVCQFLGGENMSPSDFCS